MGSGIKLDGLPHVMLYDDEGNFTILGKAVDMRQGISFDQCCNSTRVNFDLDFNYWKENCPGTNEFHPEKSPEHEMARRAAKKMLYGDESAGYEHKFPADDPTYFSTDVTRACYEGKYELVDINTTNCGVDIYDILGFKKPVSFDVKEVIYNDPAVVVYWKDGTKTVATAQNEGYDPEKGLAICFAKKALGNSYKGMGRFKRLLKKALKKKPEEDCALVIKPKVTDVTIEAEVEKKPKTRRTSKKTTE